MRSYSCIGSGIRNGQPERSNRGFVVRSLASRLARASFRKTWSGVAGRARVVGQRLRRGVVSLIALTVALVGRVAVVDAAAERPRLAGGAEVVLLERAEVGARPAVVRRGGGEQHVGFQVLRNSVWPYSLKRQQRPLATQTGPGGGDRSVGRGVDGEHALAHARYSSCHTFTTRTRRVISSAGISSPWSAPGSPAAPPSQSPALAVLLSQNGHVRHCPGRAG